MQQISMMLILPTVLFFVTSPFEYKRHRPSVALGANVFKEEVQKNNNNWNPNLKALQHSVCYYSSCSSPETSKQTPQLPTQQAKKRNHVRVRK